MERKLRPHERRLLKKVNFLEYPRERNLVVHGILRRYSLSETDEYLRYVQLVGMIKRLSSMLSKLDVQDPFRRETATALAARLIEVGVLPSYRRALSDCAAITASAFCRRRLAVILCTRGFCPHLQAAEVAVRHGHVRVGLRVVTDPSTVVTRRGEDLIAWVDGSRLHEKIQRYHGMHDDFVG